MIDESDVCRSFEEIFGRSRVATAFFVRIVATSCLGETETGIHIYGIGICIIMT